MTARDVEIELDQIVGKNSRIVVNGLDISNMARGVVFAGQVGEPTRVVIDLLPAALRAKLTGAVVVDGDTYQILVDLGWTPPAEVTP